VDMEDTMETVIVTMEEEVEVEIDTTHHHHHEIVTTAVVGVIVTTVVEIAMVALLHAHVMIVLLLLVDPHRVAPHLVVPLPENATTVLHPRVALLLAALTDSTIAHLQDTIVVVAEDTQEEVLLHVVLQGSDLHTAVGVTTETTTLQEILEVMVVEEVVMEEVAVVGTGTILETLDLSTTVVIAVIMVVVVEEVLHVVVAAVVTVVETATATTAIDLAVEVEVVVVEGEVADTRMDQGKLHHQRYSIRGSDQKLCRCVK